MKIIITINTSWNIYNFRLSLIKALQKQGHKIIALAPKDEYVKKLELEDVECYDIKINSKGINPLQDINLIKNYYKTLKSIKPDCILSYTIKPNIYCGIAAGLLQIPIINNVSGLGTLFIKESISSYIGKLLYRYAFRKSAWIFFQNQTDKLLFEELKLNSSKISSVLPGSGVDLKKFNFNRTENKGKCFLFVGRLIGDKGIREFIDSANSLSKIDSTLQFQIIGELGYNNRTAISELELKQWLQNPQINFLGKTDDMVNIYKHADIMVLPSYREGLSKSLIEAAAMSLPIVTTRVPGCQEVVVEEKNGFLCNPKDSNDLTAKMKLMLAFNETERIKMGHFSREIAESKFDESIVINQYMDKIGIQAHGNKN